MLAIDWFTDLHLPSLDHRASDMSAAEQTDMRETILKGASAYAARLAHERGDLVVNTGDNIDTTPDRVVDAWLQATVRDIFNPVADALHMLPGNHDIRHGIDPDFIQTTKVIDADEATLIFWAANVQPGKSGTNIRLSSVPQLRHKFYKATQDDLVDLARAFDQCRPSRPVLLFTHVPPNDDATHNPVDNDERFNPLRSHYKNGALALNILKQSGCSVFVFSGHRHLNRETAHGDRIRLFTMDRMTRWEDMGEHRPAGINHARIEIGKTSLTLRRSGVMPLVRTYAF
ncbi:MAG: metallophosphoesterase [Rhodospirillales bacterium]|nr:metallophosphoesterase [Alphaproteobacteria bacterium]MCB9986196.1 metallophosphoesterase [Rhodospirillales bacterium]USO07247.1 MAG: metallophosphoesterase [Rhodospirillales bacterium]